MCRAVKSTSRPTRVALESLCRDQFRPSRCGLLWHEQRVACRTRRGGLIVSGDFPPPADTRKLRPWPRANHAQPIAPDGSIGSGNTFLGRRSRPDQWPTRTDSEASLCRRPGKVEDGHAALFTGRRTRVAPESLWRDQFRPLDGDCYGMNRPTSARSDVGRPVVNGPLPAPTGTGRPKPSPRAMTSDSAPLGTGSSGGSSDGSRRS